MQLESSLAATLTVARWSASTHGQAAAPPGGGGGGDGGGWQPAVLGLDKRRLLRQEVMAEIGRNRNNQRLAQEVSQHMICVP